MKYENFLKVIMTQRKLEQQLHKAYELKIDLMDFVDDYGTITKTLLTEIYGEEGYDWYSWFCWENDYGEKDWNTTKLERNVDGQIVERDPTKLVYGATDGEGNPICYSFQSLWEYLESNYRFKDNYSSHEQLIRDAIMYALDEDGHTGDWKIKFTNDYINGLKQKK